MLRTTGLDLLRALWANDISAELARDARSPEDLLTQNRDETYSWIVILKQDAVKIKTLCRKDHPDVDVPASQVISWLRAEIRDRDSKATGRSRANPPAEQGGASGGAGGGPGSGGRGGDQHYSSQGANTAQEVRVLVAQTKSKKFNRQTVVEQAHESAARLAQSMVEGPIAAIETTDAVMEMIRATSLAEPESWRRVEHGVGTAEKKYVREVHEMLEEWRAEWKRGERGGRDAFVYNFRTGSCFHYDLGA